MSAAALPATGATDYLARHEEKPLLRFLTCGSVDDGKSTLIGRLLYDAHLVLEDQLAALADDSKREGTQGGGLDFALLVDGLAAEREQGITIDVAYRYFSTDRRTFIVADTPGHEQYTRNMVTGASTADVAVILVDARKGLLPQTRRHSYIVSLLGIRRVAVAVNKLDAIGYDRDVFEAVAEEYADLARQLSLEATCIPVSALRGDNVTAPSPATPWYQGPTLLGYLETVPVDDLAAETPWRMPVQWVNRPGLDFRGYAGLVVSGRVHPGDQLRVLPAGTQATVARIVTYDGDLDEAVPGDSVTLTLTEDVDVSRGDVLAAADAAPEVADQFEAHLIWMDPQPLLPGRTYLLKAGTREVPAAVSDLKYRVNVHSLERMAAKTLECNEIGIVTITTDQPVAFDPYEENRDMGGFILVDRFTNATVGAGLLHFALRRSHNIHWQPLQVDQASRSAMKGHRACVVWFTGLSGAGKSTIANRLEVALRDRGVHTYLLDGDNVRHGLSRDLGFTAADRVENMRRVGEVARMMADAGLVVLTAFISPFRAERAAARAMVGDGEFCEVFVDTPLAVAEERDPKGLYRQARQGRLSNFTGVDAGYEPPEAPEVRIETMSTSPDEAVAAVIDQLRSMGVVQF